MLKLSSYVPKAIKIKLFIINVLVILSFVCTPFISKIMIDNLQNHSGRQLIQIAGLQLVVFIASQLIFYFEDVVKGDYDQIVWESVFNRLNRKLRYFNTKQTVLTENKLQSQITTNFQLIQDFFYYHPMKIVLSTIRIGVVASIILYYSVISGILLLLFIPFFLIISNIFRKKITILGQNAIETQNQLRYYLLDIFKHHQSERFRNTSIFQPSSQLLLKFRKSKKHATRTTAAFQNFMMYAFLNLLILGTFFISSYQVLNGKMTFGTLFALQLYVSNLWSPSEYLLDTIKDYFSIKEIITEFDGLLQMDEVSYQNEKINCIQLSNVTLFNDAGRKITEIHKFDFVPNVLNLITGENGSGKTLLVKSILGIYDNYAGTITVPYHGENQNFEFLPATFDNSLFFEQPISATASYGQIKWHQLTQLEDKSVYIFDEPTNFLDKDNKEKVYKLIKALIVQEKIVIVISHDPGFLVFNQVNQLILN